METNSSNFTNILILSGLVVAGIVYYYAVYLPTQSANDPMVEAELLAKTQEFITHANVLQSLQVNTNILTDPNFESLTEYSSDPEEQPIAKLNPFDPISQGE